MTQGRMKMPRLDTGNFEMAFKILVSPHAAGKIIGRGGSEIAALRQQLNVGCHIHGPDTPFPGTNLQVVVLFGSRASIDQSFEGMVMKICEAEENLQQGAQLTVAVVMTNNAVSAVIGTKGTTIASLRQQAGCGFSADKDLFQGEQLVRITGPPERLPAALALLTPFADRSGDSLQMAMQDYSMAGGWDAGWMAPPMSRKGMGKRNSSPPPWSMSMMQTRAMPPMQAIMPVGLQGPPATRRRIGSPGTWQYSSQGGGPSRTSSKGRPGHGPGADGPAAALAAAAAAQDDGFGDQEATPEESTPPEDDPRVLGSPSTIAFPIPKDSIGRVLGRGGDSAEMIRSSTGATLNIEPGETEGTVMLSGTLASVQRAHCLVVARVLAKV